MTDCDMYAHEAEINFKTQLDELCPSNSKQCYYQWIPVKPEAKQSVRFRSGGGAYTDKKKKQYQGNLVAKIYPYVESMSFSGSVVVGVIFCFPWRKTDGVTDPSIMRAMPQRPDLDNLSKPLFDAMTQSGLLKDDSAIVRASIMKCRWLYPGIALKVSEHSANDYTFPLLDTK